MYINKNTQFTIIAGPCAIETEEVCFQIAEECKKVCEKFGFQYIFKASYKKANRTSGKSFRGVGISKGLEILDKLKMQFSLPIITDVHETGEIASVAKVADVLQIPAFLSRQTELIEAAAKTGKWINIKKGQFMSPNEIKLAYEKAIDCRNEKIFITERGSSFGYNNLVVDFRNFQIIADWEIPVIYDVTHSLQLPAISKTSGGNPEFIFTLSKAAVATGKLSGLFVETHPKPAQAKSDAKSMLPLNKMNELVETIHRILPSTDSTTKTTK